MPISVYGEEVQGLVKALGLEGSLVKKFVLEVDCDSDDPVKLYVVQYVAKDQAVQLASALEGMKVVVCDSVTVDDKGNVLTNGEK